MPTCAKNQVETVRREVADLRYRFGIADRRTVRLLPSLPDAQLELPLLVDGETKVVSQPGIRTSRIA